MFKVIAQRGEERKELGVCSLTDERHLIEKKKEYEKLHPGWKFYFHPNVTIKAMYATGSFNQLPREERK